MRSKIALTLILIASGAACEMEVETAVEAQVSDVWRATKLGRAGPTLTGELVLQTSQGLLRCQDTAALQQVAPGGRYRLRVRKALIGDAPVEVLAVEPLGTLFAHR